MATRPGANRARAVRYRGAAASARDTGAVVSARFGPGRAAAVRAPGRAAPTPDAAMATSARFGAGVALAQGALHTRLLTVCRETCRVSRPDSPRTAT